MPVNLSIKNVPDGLADALRDRAERNHRSMQGELMAILETALAPPATALGDTAARRDEKEGGGDSAIQGSPGGVRTVEQALSLIREEARPR